MLDEDALDGLYRVETELFKSRIPKSLDLWNRGKMCMPSGVPCSWMVASYDHPPIFMQKGEGAYLTDVDGNRYLDMNHADMSMSCGYGHPGIVAAVAGQAKDGSQFLLPHALAIEVSGLLAERFGLPKWQYTLSASLANKECARIARKHTQRERVLVFSGSYHGHIAETLDARALQRATGARTDIFPKGSDSIPFNDLEVLDRALKSGRYALVMMEPAMTNCSLVAPLPGFIKGVRECCSRCGTLLLVDETHTHVCAWGGLTREWGIARDFVTLGKSIAGGIPMGVYGMTDALADTVAANTLQDRWPEEDEDRLPLGGTLFGYPLALAAARAALTEVLTPEGHRRCAELGRRLADGLDTITAERGLPWSAFRLYCRSGICYARRPPANAREASRLGDYRLNRYQRLFMANRGVWEAIVTAGPAVSFAMHASDVDLYLRVFAEMLDSLPRAQGS